MFWVGFDLSPHPTPSRLPALSLVFLFLFTPLSDTFSVPTSISFFLALQFFILTPHPPSAEISFHSLQTLKFALFSSFLSFSSLSLSLSLPLSLHSFASFSFLSFHLFIFSSFLCDTYHFIISHLSWPDPPPNSSITPLRQFHRRLFHLFNAPFLFKAHSPLCMYFSSLSLLPPSTNNSFSRYILSAHLRKHPPTTTTYQTQLSSLFLTLPATTF
ncbi:unnamed protein product [Acanthosepion pharaonis]|uniref:Uncharacterized protein n=1 Tax=Acanthosepion pharaonis TaxID=158019 RepID=A0A812DAZ9_ACAPH|nr:unnamed protein product [Sepia pharaonis]